MSKYRGVPVWERGNVDSMRNREGKKKALETDGILRKLPKVIAPKSCCLLKKRGKKFSLLVCLGRGAAQM